MNAQIEPFFDTATWTWSYVVHAGPGSACAIVDPVLDYDPKSGRTRTASAHKLLDFVRSQRLSLAWILETHAHADHLSAAAWLQDQAGGRIAIGAAIPRVQDVFKKVFHLEDLAADGSQFDHLITEGETLALGPLQLRAMAVPGHTPACMAYQVGDAVFVGDTLFAPDVGSARCDFPGGDAGTLYRSVRKLLALPGSTRLFLCHDYPPAGREPVCMATVDQQRQSNIHLRDGIGEADFVAMRRARDAGLEMPTLILPAIQVNIRAGRLPVAESNGVRYLKIPLDAL